MQVEIPKKLDWLKHYNWTDLTPEQITRWDNICQLNDLINIATRDHRDPATNRPLPTSFTVFLDDLYSVAFSEYSKCHGRLTIDNYVDIALFSLPSLKHIVSAPSTHIVKVAQKVPVSSLKQTTAKTMRWLSKRSGRTVQEKIAPQNKVLTNLTVFSADTKENRETIYLYRILYDIINKRLNPSGSDKVCPCVGCQKPCIVPMREINALISLHTMIKKNELADVPPQKQSVQNNKLMCDQYYKRIWDAVRMDREQELNITAVWDKMPERYLQITYWLILAALLHDFNLFIYDSWGVFEDKNGILSFKGEVIDAEHTTDTHVQIFSTENPDMTYTLCLNDNTITLSNKTNNDIVFLCDFSNIVEAV